MSGFVKGMVVGVVSFGLGFVVLSVVMPVEPPAAPGLAPDLPGVGTPAASVDDGGAPVEGAPVEAAPVEMASAGEASTGAAEPQAAPEDPAPEGASEAIAPVMDAPVMDAPLMDAPLADTPVADPSNAEAAPAPSEPRTATEVAVSEALTQALAAGFPEAPATAAMPEPVSEPATGPETGAAAVDAPGAGSAEDLPEAGTQRPDRALDATVGEPDQQTSDISGPAQPRAADAAGFAPQMSDNRTSVIQESQSSQDLDSESSPIVAEAGDVPATAGPSDMPTEPERETAAEEAPGAETLAGLPTPAAVAPEAPLLPALQPVPADPATVALIEPGLAEPSTPTPTDIRPTVPAPVAPMSRDPEAAPEAGGPRSAAEPASPPEAPPGPVNATRTPAGEPLIGTTGGARPSVRSLPLGAGGVAVRRGSGDGSQMPGGPVEGVTTGRLPVIAPQSEPAIAVAPAHGAAEAAADASLPALARYAAVPALAADETAMGVILEDGPAAETAILAFPVPVTILVNPFDPEAPRRAAAYRAAGHEIALKAEGLPPRAQPSDLLVILEAWARNFPEVVAIVDVPINGIGANAGLSRELVRAIAPAGFGIVTQRNGLDALLQAGRAAGLAALPVYRVLDDDDQSEPVIRRLIDRAAFEAERQPGVLILGRAENRPTMQELGDFAQGRGRGGVALVPASTLLLDQ